MSKAGTASRSTQKSGPHNYSDVLGIEIDSVALVLRLPADKLGRPRGTLASWESKRHAFKHELQVLIGLLNHVATVTRPGCTFIRQLIVASKLPRRQSHMQGSAKCGLPVEPSVVVVVYPGMPAGETIVSGSWGCGAYCVDTNVWFQLQWPPLGAKVNIAIKELIYVVVGQ